MLGFSMTKHPRYQHSLEDLFLHVYVLVDDWLKENEARFSLPKQCSQVAAYSELFTIAIVGEIMAQPYESVWYWLVKQSHQNLFPKLPEYSRYHRITRNAEKLWAELALELVGDSLAALKIVDAKPLPIAKGKRAEWAKCLEASKGFSTMGMVYGFKLHALVNERGLFERWSFAPAHHHEAAVVPELVQGVVGCIVGDKAYLGNDAIVTPKRKNMTEPSCWNKTLNRLRKRIETSFSVLVGSLTLHAAQVKTSRSLRTRVNLKIAVHNLIHSGLLSRWQTG
jgi:hypothetical protein